MKRFQGANLIEISRSRTIASCGEVGRNDFSTINSFINLPHERFVRRQKEIFNGAGAVPFNGKFTFKNCN
ncbi:MAG: hypothetical protein KBG17_08925 [Paludibacteraceae bacterium]|jgi:hypothetical protein|nr:hypothetical protein [Paludibacteraceae bacterium]